LNACQACRSFARIPHPNPNHICSKSGAAAGPSGCVFNICKFFRIYQDVAPKRDLLDEANMTLASIGKKPSGINLKFGRRTQGVLCAGILLEPQL
jgi:dynein heavy chain